MNEPVEENPGNQISENPMISQEQMLPIPEPVKQQENYELNLNLNLPKNESEYSSEGKQNPDENFQHENQALLQKDSQNQGDNSMKPKKHRRSKNQTEGKFFECNVCNKSYFSNSSLYNHMKIKHNMKGNEQIETLGGIPNVQNIKKAEIPNIKSNLEEIPIIYGFKNAFELLYKDRNFYDHNLYRKLLFQHRNLKMSINYNPDYLKEELSDEIFQKMILLNQPSQLNTKISCDEILSKYLEAKAHKSTSYFYPKIVEFVLFYREYFNEIVVSDRSSGRLFQENRLRNDLHISNYCEVENAEMIPKFCNSFYYDFFLEKSSTISKELAIELIGDLCKWLNDNSYSKIKIIKND